MRVLIAFLALVACANAQDTGSTAVVCDSGATYAKKTIPEVQGAPSKGAYDADVCVDGPNSTACKCYPSSLVGKTVEVEGVVTEVGGIKNAYEFQYYQIQTQDGAAFGGIEIYHPGYNKAVPTMKKGSTVIVKGKVKETHGMTVLDACSTTVKTGAGVNTTIPAFMEIMTKDFKWDKTKGATYGNCRTEAEKYEGMLVKVKNAKVIDCATALTHVAGSSGNCIAPSPTSKNRCAQKSQHDKYKQMFVTNGADDEFMEMDNHYFDVFSTYDVNIDAGDVVFTEITGALHYAYGQWELVPFTADDIKGGKPVVAEDPTVVTIRELQGQPDAYNSIPKTKYGKDVGGSATWDGSCPSTTIQNDLSKARSKTQNLCACFPAKYYDGSCGNSGKGDRFVKVTATVQAKYGKSNYICDGDKPYDCIFIYDSLSQKVDGKTVTAEAGDKIEIVALTYEYYGNSQLSDPAYWKIISKANKMNTPIPVALNNFNPPGKTFCKKESEQFEAMKISVGPVTVSRLIRNEKDVRDYQGYRCNGQYGWTCEFEVEDSTGGKLLIDNKFNALNEITGCKTMSADKKTCNEHYPVKVGDTFTSIVGVVDQHRGYGGHYELHPISKADLKGLNTGKGKAEPSAGTTTTPPAAPAESAAGKMAAILAVVAAAFMMM